MNISNTASKCPIENARATLVARESADAGEKLNCAKK